METKTTGLFVIRKLTQPQFWQCSTEHGAGWHPGRPKQAFSRSELTAELRRLIDEGWFCSIIIMQLSMPSCEKLLTGD